LLFVNCSKPGVVCSSISSHSPLFDLSVWRLKWGSGQGTSYLILFGYSTRFKIWTSAIQFLKFTYQTEYLTFSFLLIGQMNYITPLGTLTNHHLFSSLLVITFLTVALLKNRVHFSEMKSNYWWGLIASH
jgi:hypothetical protein